MAIDSKKKNQDEFSPWPPFVDIFAATIMVLLLFMLILFALVAHYAKLVKEDLDPQPIQEQVDPPNVNERIKNIISIKQRDVNVPLSIDNNTTAPTEDTNIGGAVTLELDKKQVKPEFKKEEMLLIFKDMDIFIDRDILGNIEESINKHLQSNANSKIELTVGDPKRSLSSTYAKQISLGRVINLKNKLEDIAEFKDRVKIRVDTKDDPIHDFGHIKLQVTN